MGIKCAQLLSDKRIQCRYLLIDVEKMEYEWVGYLPGNQQDNVDQHYDANESHQMSVSDGLQDGCTRNV